MATLKTFRFILPLMDVGLWPALCFAFLISGWYFDFPFALSISLFLILKSMNWIMDALMMMPFVFFLLKFLDAFLFTGLQIMMLCTHLMMMIYDCISLKIAQ